MKFARIGLLALVLNLMGAWAHSDEPVCRPACDAQPLNRAQIQNVAYVAQAAATYPVNELFAAASDHLGGCFDMANRDKDPAYTKNVIVPGMLKEIRNAKFPKGAKEDGSPITEQDWLNVDLIARALIGEISTTNSCEDHELYGVARVIFDRAEFVRHDAGKQWKQFADSQGGNSYAEVITHKGQFLSNFPKDPANRWFKCPPHDIDQTYYDGAGGIGGYINYSRSLDIATQMIFTPEAFRRRTKGLTGALSFTKGRDAFDKFNQPDPDTGKPRYRRIVGSVDGHKVNNVNCVQLWRPLDFD